MECSLLKLHRPITPVLLVNQFLTFVAAISEPYELMTHPIEDEDTLNIKEEDIESVDPIMTDINEGDLTGRVDANSLMIKVDDMWACTACGHTRRQKSHVREHVESVHLRVQVTCPICDKKVLKSGMRSHKKNHQKADLAAAQAMVAGGSFVGHYEPS